MRRDYLISACGSTGNGGELAFLEFGRFMFTGKRVAFSRLGGLE